MENKYHDIEQKIKDIFVFCSINNINYNLTYGGDQNFIKYDDKSVDINLSNVEVENLNDYLELKLTEIKEKHDKKEK
jgi:hypothetical protein